MADEYDAAVQQEESYVGMFSEGTQPDSYGNNNIEHSLSETDNVISTGETKDKLKANGLSLPQIKDSIEGKGIKTKCDNHSVLDNSAYNRNSANDVDTIKCTSTPTSTTSSHSPLSPASPIMLSPQSPTHWSLSPRTSPSGSTGPSPRSMSPASPTSKVQITISKEEIMQAYALQEKTFQEEFLKQTSPDNLKSTPRTRSSSHSPARPQSMNVGIDHLDNLVRLMEQLSSLKEENATLRKKCHYLHDTKTLLQVQNEMLLFRKELANIASSPKKIVRTRSKRLQKGRQNRPVMDIRSISNMERRASDSSNDGPESRRERPGSAKLSQRSQSVGSINVHESNVDLDLDVLPNKHEKRSIRDKRKLETMFSKSLITSKWNQVKKVFSGKPEVNTKTETTCVSAEQLVRANSKHVGRLHKEGSIGGSSSQDSSDNKDRQHGVRTSGGEYIPPSPSSMISDTGRPSLVAEDPEYEEIHPTEHQQQGPEPDPSFRSSHGSSFGSDEGSHDNSKNTSPNKQQTKLPKTPTSDDEGKKQQKIQSSPQFLTVDIQPHGGRRQSTPLVWTAEDLDLIDRIELEPSKSPRIRRSSSFKTTKRQNSLDVPDDIAAGNRRARSPEMRKNNRSAWGRVKDIIHTRKDSLKRKNRRSNSAGEMLPDATGFDDYYLTYDSPEGSTSQPSSPKYARKATKLPDHSPRSSRSPPRKKANQTSPMESPQPIQRQDSLAQALSSSPLDVSALIGGVSEEFTKKMQEWEDKKRQSIFSKEGSISLDEDGNATKFNEDFIRKMEEWERKKGLASRTREEAQSPPIGGPSSKETDSSKDVLSETFVKTVQEWERVKTKKKKVPTATLR